MTVLAGYRVVDLTGPEGWLAGMLLAGFGAEVIKIEPPGGDPGRAIPPLAERLPRKPGLYWLTWNRGKKSVTLDLARDRVAARRLFESADFILESGRPGHLAPFGLDYDSIREANPAVIYLSISPFGQTGPYAHYQVSDLIAQAAGGHLYLDGTDEQPLRPSMDTAYAQVGAQAAVAAMLAHNARLRDGRGQFIDLSIQEAIVVSMDWYTAGWDVDHIVRRRHGVGRFFADYNLDRVVFHCRDGYVTTFSYFDAFGPNHGAFVELLALRGLALHPDLAAKLADPAYRPDQSEIDEIIALCSRLASTFTRAELVEECQKRRSLAAELYAPDELLTNEHLAARGYWQRRSIPPFGEVDLPGPPLILDQTPWRVPDTLATPGEHNPEILGPSKAPARRVTTDISAPLERGIFAGIRIADFSWVGVGPLATKYFADQGAEVIRVESSHHLDVLRGAGPWPYGERHVDGSPYYANFNSSKLGAALNMSHPDAPDLAMRLIDRCDVVAESYRPGVMEKWGLTCEKARERNPGLIWVRLPMFGLAGPWADRAGYGHTLQAVVGVSHMVGLPDGEPLGASHAFTDFFGPHFGALALAAALAHRERTGQGQLIEICQMEAGLYVLGPLPFEAQFNDPPIRCGNRHPAAAPHNTYPGYGADRWLALACFTEDQWLTLVDEIGSPAWTRDPRFADLGARKRNETALDDHVASWTRNYPPEELMHRLQARGVPAALVATVEDLRKDPQLAHRDHFWFLDHPYMGRRAYDAHSFRLSRTPERLSRPAPLLGQHNDYVWRELVGLDDERLAGLIAGGALE